MASELEKTECFCCTFAEMLFKTNPLLKANEYEIHTFADTKTYN